MRGGKQHFVYSKIMCWVALDRGLRLADRRSFPAPRDKWLRVRDEIYEEIMKKGWSESRQAFTQSFGSDHLDAANLIMPLVFFLAPNGTVKKFPPFSNKKSGLFYENRSIYYFGIFGGKFC